MKFLRFIEVKGFPDNINYDPANDQLYIGCTSKLGEFFKVAAAITMYNNQIIIIIIFLRKGEI